MQESNLKAIQNWLLLSNEEKSSHVQLLVGIDLLSGVTKNRALINAANRYKPTPDKCIEFLEYQLQKFLPADSTEVMNKEEDGNDISPENVLKTQPINAPISLDLADNAPEELKKEYYNAKIQYGVITDLHSKLKDAETNEARKEIIEKMINAEDIVKDFWNKYDRWKEGEQLFQDKTSTAPNYEGKSLAQLLEESEAIKAKIRNKQNTVNRAVKDSKSLKGAKKAHKEEDIKRHVEELNGMLEQQKAIDEAIEMLQSGEEE